MGGGSENEDKLHSLNTTMYGLGIVGSILAALVFIIVAYDEAPELAIASLFLVIPCVALGIFYARFVYYIFNVLIGISLTLKLIQAKQENEAEEKAKVVHGEQ